MARASAD